MTTLNNLLISEMLYIFILPNFMPYLWRPNTTAQAPDRVGLSGCFTMWLSPETLQQGHRAERSESCLQIIIHRRFMT